MEFQKLLQDFIALLQQLQQQQQQQQVTVGVAQGGVHRLTGCRPSSRHSLMAAAPHRIVGATPAEWYWLPKWISMWLNATYGCCVTSSEAFAKACFGIRIQDKTVGQWAQSHGVLNGADISSVLQWMQNDGFQQDGNQYNDGPATGVNWEDRATLCNAISKAPVKLGVAAAQLQKVVGSKNGWWGSNFIKDTNLDHCVELCGYGPVSRLFQVLGVPVPSQVNPNTFGYHLFTWDTIGVIDEPSMQAITGEAWLRNPVTVMMGSNPVPTDEVVTPTPQPTPSPVPVPNPNPPPWVPPPAPPNPGPQPTPMPVPVPTPTPTPSPVNIQQELDNLLNQMIARAANSQVKMILILAKRYIDIYITQYMHELRSVQSSLGDGNVPKVVIDLIENAFQVAAADYPDFAPILEMVGKMVVSYLPNVTIPNFWDFKLFSHPALQMAG